MKCLFHIRVYVLNCLDVFSWREIVMRLTLVLYFSLKLVSSKNIDEKDTILVFEQLWPVCEDINDCPFSCKSIKFLERNFKKLVIWFLIAIDGARFVTNSVFVIEHLEGLPIRNCPLDHHLNMSMLAEMDTDLEFAWPNWPKKKFRFQSALEQEWNNYASCFMDFMKTNNCVFMFLSVINSIEMGGKSK